jgi:hypothetical protein
VDAGQPGLTATLQGSVLEVGAVRVSLDEPLVKAGILFIGRDVRGTLRASIAPAELAAKVELRSSNAQRAVVSEEDRQGDGGAVTAVLRIRGVEATPAERPDGDAEVQAWVGEVPCAAAKILIVVPMTQEHSVGPATLENSVVPKHGDPQRRAFARSETTAIVTITVYDQFGQRLDHVYDGERVVTEAFFETRGFFAKLVEQKQIEEGGEYFVREPDAKFYSGTKLDATGYVRTEQDILLRPDQFAPWRRKQLRLLSPPRSVSGGGNNVWAVAGVGDQDGSFIQVLRVHGHRVAPDFHRTQRALWQNDPPAPLEVQDTPVP